MENITQEIGRSSRDLQIEMLKVPPDLSSCFIVKCEGREKGGKKEGR